LLAFVAGRGAGPAAELRDKAGPGGAVITVTGVQALASAGAGVTSALRGAAMPCGG